jgi:hypothetical protein
MLQRAVEKHPTDFAAIVAALPANFDTDHQEVNLMLAHLGKPLIELPPGAVIEQSSGDGVKGERPADTLSSDEMTIQEATAILNDWQHKVQLARDALRDRGIEQKAARGKLVEAITFFLTGNKSIGRDELIRQHLASEAAERAARAANGGRRSRAPSHGPSAYDIGRAGHGGNVNRRYAPTRRGVLPGQRAYSLEGSIARSGSGIIDTHGRAPLPADKTE